MTVTAEPKSIFEHLRRLHAVRDGKKYGLSEGITAFLYYRALLPFET